MTTIIENKIPYDSLKEIGIDRKAFLNLPVDALDKLLTFRLSPVLECNVTTSDAKEYSFLAKLLFILNGNNVDLKLYPIQKELKSDIPLTNNEIKVLRNGGVVQKRIKIEGKRVFSYIQLDRETLNIISANVNQIYIPKRLNDTALTKKQIEKIKKGEPVEISTNETTITVGINLEYKRGLNVIKGSLEDWNELKNEDKTTIKYLKYSNGKWESIKFNTNHQENISNYLKI